MPKATVVKSEDGGRVTQEVNIVASQLRLLEKQYGRLPPLLTFDAVSKRAEKLGLNLPPKKIAYQVSSKRIPGISIKPHGK